MYQKELVCANLICFDLVCSARPETFYHATTNIETNSSRCFHVDALSNFMLSGRHEDSGEAVGSFAKETEGQ